MKTRQGLVSRDRLRRESEASADSPEMELEIPEGRVLPLNSKQLTSVQLQAIPWALDLPARGSWEDIRLTIEGKLREDYDELSVQVAVQEISETETKVISDWQERSVPGGWCWVKRGECTCRVGGSNWFYHRTNTFGTSKKQTPLNSEQQTLISPRRTLANTKLPPKTETETILALLLIVLAFLISVKLQRGLKMQSHRVQKPTPLPSYPGPFSNF